jgi:deoxyribodipyrimidine photo-lyase
MPRSVLWFRRDLRLHDHPALLAARDAGDEGVLPLFVLDPALWRPAGAPRQAYLLRSLRALGGDLEQRGGRLHVRRGDPVEQVLAAARSTGASTVYVSADFAPYGSRRDRAVERTLTGHGIDLVRTGSPYAVNPGRVRTRQGTPYSVFTPFSRAWADLGWRSPAPLPLDVTWATARGEGDDLYAEPDLGALELPPAGERAARERWREFRDDGLDRYADTRDRPDLEATSRLSHHLKWGEIHPRTLLADVAERSGKGPRTFRQELAWREFYADVLHHHPDSARDYFRTEYGRMPHDDPDERFDAWRAGRTGFPFVDAGMRQLLAEGWMHNRLRMVVASFLVKDLHVEWQHGARHFMRHLRDADLASNQHGWQWTAGSGTDAAPYFRVFNPVSQGRRFDPGGDYVRRYVGELGHLRGGAAHEPWEHPDGYEHGYPERIVDHGVERAEALRRYETIRR